jgi:putative flippase GtrA
MEGKPINHPRNSSLITEKSALISHIFRKKNDTLNQFIKYITLGNISNFVDFAGLYILTRFAGVHYLISAALSFITGVTTGYIISVLWIFRRGRHKFHVEILLIFAVSLLGLFLNELIIFLLTGYLSIHYMVSKIVSALVVMFWNFFARRKWIFLR